MNALLYYVSDFFDSLTLDADRAGHSYKVMLSESMKSFMENQNNENAYVVYNMFFDVFRVGCKENRMFVDLLDMLRTYEENTGRFSDGQRDHYIHSVNVFLLGLSIYARNSAFREAVAAWDNAPGHRMLFTTHQEEFLFTWGVAALFHDIGYPVELTSKQFQQFIYFVADDGKKEIGPYLDYLRFDKLDAITDSVRPTKLLAEHLAATLHTDPTQTDTALAGFLKIMQQCGFVDHGFYSALIVLKWYGETLLGTEEETVFRHQILPAASAIYLHNAYKNTFQKTPFACPPLQAENFPLGYLLIFCDEAQEWNRRAYGKKASAKVGVDDSAIAISDSEFRLHYITHAGLLEAAFLRKKHDLYYRLLDIRGVFSEGVTFTATTQSEQYAQRIRAAQALPRPLAENIELIARKIHADYNAKQLERHPDTPLAYPTWETLPDTLKYSNIRQAQGMGSKLAKIGCCIVPAGEGGSCQLTADEIEYLALCEHDDWVAERRKNGWEFGAEKDVDKKLSPYMVSYDALTEDVKDLDRDTIRNMEPLLRSVGLAIRRQAPESELKA